MTSIWSMSNNDWLVKSAEAKYTPSTTVAIGEAPYRIWGIPLTLIRTVPGSCYSP